ncbi:MAG: prenyltransferase [Anaerolineae bacterium]
MTAARWTARALAFARLGRPQFLAGGFLFYGLGAVMALYAGAPFRWAAFAWGQVAVTAVQLMVHYANDYFDLAADRANGTPTRWSGGSRVLPAGDLAPPVALGAALVFGAIALSATAALSWAVRPAPLTLPLLLAGAALAWSYSGPPLYLQARGLGGPTAAAVVTVLTPLIGFYLQAGSLDALPLLAALPPAGLQCAMLLIVDVPDAAGDAAAGKRTLVVRIGAARAMRLHNVILLAVYAMLPLLARLGLPPGVAGAVLLSAPVALWHAGRVARGDWADPARWNRLAFWSVALLVGAGMAELLAFAALLLA